MSRILQIVEYEPFSVEVLRNSGFSEQEARKFYKEISDFAQENQNQFLAYSRRGILKAQNYAGIIQTKSGYVLEILPKIAKNTNIAEAKEVLIRMLKSLTNSPFRTQQKADLKTRRMPLWEIFIQMFLDELDRLIKTSIKSDYIPQRANQSYLKGKLLIHKQINQNTVHKEHFYIEYDEYLPDRVENRILKTALLRLYRQTRNFSTQKQIRRMLFIFDNIQPVHNIAAAFSKVKKDRTISHYEKALLWAKLFLRSQSFTPYHGNSIAFALLFDMNQLFESYVAKIIKQLCRDKKVKLQHAAYYLFDNPRRFRLKPDIVINNGEIILDTKWKIITEEKDISQADLYQIFAYAAKYPLAEQILLVYPLMEKVSLPEYSTVINARNIKFTPIFFDLQTDKFYPFTPCV